jgi:hypothetical protein
MAGAVNRAATDNLSGPAHAGVLGGPDGATAAAVDGVLARRSTPSNLGLAVTLW